MILLQRSVFLKTVTLIVILAQVGSRVPAERAEVHPVRAIFTRVSSFDAFPSSQSTFFANCSFVVGMLNGLESNATLPVLAILDEFGKGSSEVDGIALHAALLRRYRIETMRQLCVSARRTMWKCSSCCQCKIRRWYPQRKLTWAATKRRTRMLVLHGAEAAAERRLVRDLDKLDPLELMGLVHAVELHHRKVVEQERAKLRRAQTLGALP